MPDALCSVPACWTCSVIASARASAVVPGGDHIRGFQFAPLVHNLQFLISLNYISSVEKLMDCISPSSVRSCDDSLSICLPIALTSMVVMYLISLRE